MSDNTKFDMYGTCSACGAALPPPASAAHQCAYQPPTATANAAPVTLPIVHEHHCGPSCPGESCIED